MIDRFFKVFQVKSQCMMMILNQIAKGSKCIRQGFRIDSEILQLILYNGNYYDELQPANYQKRTKNRPQVKSSFDKYLINIDISDFNNIDFDNKDASSRYNMLGINELNKTIDSLKKNFINSTNEFSNKILVDNSINRLQKKYKLDKIETFPDLLTLFSDVKALSLINYSSNSIKNTKSILNIKSKSNLMAKKNINKHIIALHDKFTIGLMCVVLFFIGAPLGALIRKGGVGTPMIIAILIFLSYHFISIFAKNSSEDSSLNPIFATCLAGIIMLPFSIYLTKQATNDRALFDFKTILMQLKKVLVKSKLLTIFKIDV